MAEYPTGMPQLAELSITAPVTRLWGDKNVDNLGNLYKQVRTKGKKVACNVSKVQIGEFI